MYFDNSNKYRKTKRCSDLFYALNFLPIINQGNLLLSKKSKMIPCIPFSLFIFAALNSPTILSINSKWIIGARSGYAA